MTHPQVNGFNSVPIQPEDAFAYVSLGEWKLSDFKIWVDLIEEAQYDRGRQDEHDCLQQMPSSFKQ